MRQTLQAHSFRDTGLQDLTDLAERMAHGIEVKDRSRHFKKYRSCFTGGPQLACIRKWHYSQLPHNADFTFPCNFVWNNAAGKPQEPWLELGAVAASSSDAVTMRPCSTGRQAVAWLLKTAAVASDEAEAVAIGNALMHRGLLHHVVCMPSFYLPSLPQAVPRAAMSPHGSVSIARPV